MAAVGSAKVKSSLFHSMQSSRSAVSLKNVLALENRLRPYLERRINHSPATAQNQLNESDLFLLAKLWKSLSPEFRQLYQEATQIPSGDTYYVSPSGHFEVYYTTKGADRISATDNYGFGAAGNWRTKNNQPNGVPDYVDEVAWDLDSAWSMEIGQFNYIQPIPYTDPTHTSNKFKVVIANLGEGYYGETYPGDTVGSHGFSSHIEINNNWSGPDWAGTGYDTIPYNGARVTCPHEFFHTIQYAMAWNLSFADQTPDSFPLSWLEGTAVMMEGLAFRYVYDYIQYASDYFDDPAITMLDPSDTSETVYTNSLITKFLHELESPDPKNDFIRHIFFDDYNAPVNFYQDLHSVSSSLGKNWVDILNGFHTQSFFTGSRAITSIFLQDSPLLPQWSYGYDYFNAAQTLTKQVNPYAMQLFALQPAQSQGDTMGFVFQGDNFSSSYPAWSASCILERLNGTDSIVHFSFSNNTLAALEIPSWHSLQDALVVVTNGDIAARHNASLSFQLCPITYPAGSQHTFSSMTPTDTAIVSLKAQTALRCSLTVTAVTDDSLLAIAAKNRLFPATDLFAVSFPATWSSGSSISLAINSTTSIQIAPQTLGLYVWNGAAWSKVPDTVSFTHQSLRATAAVAQPGVYSVLYSSTSAADAVAVYPNPVHLRAGSSVKIAGKNILDIWVYDIGGKMISRATTGALPSPASLPESSSGFNWLLTNASGKTVFPGMYYVCLDYKDAVTQAVKKKKEKILVIP